MVSSQRFAITDESSVGEARREVSGVCERVGGGDEFCGRASIVITEMGRNMVRHAGGGLLLARQLPSQIRPGIELLALDRGPGMHNVSECLTDGFSSIGTAGTGLGAISRQADEFDVFSRTGMGTVVWAHLAAAEARQPLGGFQIGGVSVALEREDVCGDAWDVIQTPGSLRVILADGLGHGTFAAEAAREALAVFRANPTSGVAETLELAHQALTKTRGAAAALAEIRAGMRQVTSGGVGNVAMRILHESGAKSLISDNGTLGASVRRVQEATAPFQAGSLLVMHSDGLAANWNLEEYPGLQRKHPAVVAGVLYRDFRRDRDDVTVVVVGLNA